MEWLENLKAYFIRMRKRNEKNRAELYQKEIRNRIRLKVSENGEVLMIIKDAGNTTAIRKFEDGETIKDVKAAIKQVTEVAVGNSTSRHI
jgi:hypothetical protein